MLSDKLRDGANSKAFKGVLAVIIISFVLTGVGGYLIPRLDTDPVTIGEYKISAQEWNEQYNRQAQQLHRYGPQAAEALENPEYVKTLKMQILEELINNVAFNSTVWNLDIRIGDEQVRDVIRNTPAFQKDNKFDNDLYLATIRNMGLNPEYFGEQLRVSLMSESISRPLLQLSSIALPYEISAIAKLLSQRRIVDIYTVDRESIASSVKVADSEAQSYYNEHNDEFMAPANVRFNYLLLSVNDLRKEVEVDDTKVEEYYNLYQDDFKLDEQRQLSHIIIKKDSTDAAKRISAVEQGIAKNEDFAKLAQEYSDDNVTKKQGGDMGLVSKGQLAANLDSVLFSLTVGQVSQKIEDAYGTHFIKLTKVVAPHVPPLAAIKDEVKQAYINSKARELFNERVSTMSDLSFENPDSLDATAEALKLTIRDSNVVSLGDTQAVWPLNNSEVQKVAFDEDVYSAGVNSPVVTIDEDNALVLNVIEYHDASLKDFESVKSDAIAKVTQNKINEQSHKALEDVAKLVIANKDATLPENIQVRKAVELAAGSSEVGPQFSQAIFALPREANSYVIDNNNGETSLAVLEKVNEADAETLKSFEQIINTQLSQYLSFNTQNALYRQARSLNDIEYNQEAIDLVTRANESAE